jgi:hypothetical protein
MRRWLRILCPDWVCVPLAIACAVAVSDMVLTHRTDVASAMSSYSLSGDRQASVPIRFWMDERFSRPEIDAIRAAFATWQRDPGSDVTFVFMGTTPTPDRAVDDGRNVIVRSARSIPAGATTALAMTVRTLDGGTRTYRDTDVVLDFSGRYRWSLDGERLSQDLQGVMTHEIGHMLGLEDVTDPDQVMYRVHAPGHTDKRELRWGDLAAVATVYPAPGPQRAPAAARGPRSGRARQSAVARSARRRGIVPSTTITEPTSHAAGIE